MNISISRDGVEIGEWTEDDVRVLYSEGQLFPSDHYWKEGMEGWKTLGTFIKPPPPTLPRAFENRLPPSPSPPPFPLVEFTLENNSDNILPKTNQRLVNAPVTRWRDGLFLFGIISIAAIVILVAVETVIHSPLFNASKSTNDTVKSEPTPTHTTTITSATATVVDTTSSETATPPSGLPSHEDAISFSSNDTKKDIFNKVKKAAIFEGDDLGYGYGEIDGILTDDQGNAINPLDKNNEEGFRYDVSTNDDGRGGVTSTDSVIFKEDQLTEYPVFVKAGVLQHPAEKDDDGGGEPQKLFKVFPIPPLDSIGTEVHIVDTRQVKDPSFKKHIVWFDNFNTFNDEAEESYRWGNFVPSVGDKGNIIHVGVLGTGQIIYCVAIDTPAKTYYVNVMSSGLTVINPTSLDDSSKAEVKTSTTLQSPNVPTNDKPVAPREKDGSPAKAFIIITAPDGHFHVGQLIPLRIEFYIRLDVDAKQTKQPTIKGNDISMVSITHSGEETLGTLEGRKFIRESWTTSVSAKKTGDYSLQMERDVNFSAGILNDDKETVKEILNRQALSNELVESNLLTLHIRDLSDGQ